MNNNKTLLERANTAFRANRYEDSLVKYRELLNQNPELDSIVHFNIHLAELKISKDDANEFKNTSIEENSVFFIDISHVEVFRGVQFEGEGQYLATSPDPQFHLSNHFVSRINNGSCFYKISVEIECESQHLLSKLYIESGSGFSEKNAVTLFIESGKRVDRIFYYTEDIQSLRFDPIEGIGSFKLKSFSISNVDANDAFKQLLTRLQAKKVRISPNKINDQEYLYKKYDNTFQSNEFNLGSTPIESKKSLPRTAYDSKHFSELNVNKSAVEQILSNFDEQSYLIANNDVEESGLSGLEHFVRMGASEILQGKRRLYPLAPLMSIEEYTQLYQDVEENYSGTPEEHFFLHGMKEITLGNRPCYKVWPEFKCDLTDIKDVFGINPPFFKMTVLIFDWDRNSLVELEEKLHEFNRFIHVLHVSSNYLDTHRHIVTQKQLPSKDQLDSEYILFLGKGSQVLIKQLLQQIISSNCLEKSCDLIYWDEVWSSSKQRYDLGVFKPNSSPEYLLNKNYIGQSAVFSRDFVNLYGVGFYTSVENVYYLALHALKLNKKVTHFPCVITYESAELRKELARKEYSVLKYYLTHNHPYSDVEKVNDTGDFRIKLPILETVKVSIVIPFRDKPELIVHCLDSIYRLTTYSNFEVILVNNNSAAETIEMMSNHGCFDYPNLRMVEYSEEFNYSKINNFAVNNFTSGDYILLLNNDIKVISEHWIQEMLQYAQMESVGAVGAKLLYENETIQHAGLVTGPFYNVSSAFIGAQVFEPGYMSRLITVSNYVALTAACLMVSKEKYQEVNGLDEENFKVAYNDVDFCINLHRAGYRNVFTPHSLLYHYESVSRGFEVTLEKTERVSNELWSLKKKNHDLFDLFDPFYNPNLSKISAYARFEYAEKYIPSNQSYVEKEFTEKVVYETRFISRNKNLIGVFSHFDKDDLVDPYVITYLKAISEFMDIVFVSTASGLKRKSLDKVKSIVSKIIVKENYGYDFGAWKTGLDHVGSKLNSYDGLVLLNDSVYGPIKPLNPFFKKAKEYDVLSMTDSYELKYHLQSYFVYFSKEVVLSDLFKDFWGEFKIIENKMALIMRNEIGFYSKFFESKFNCGSYIESKVITRLNITHFYWREIVDLGFPFIKVELLRDNPVGVSLDGWDGYIDQNHMKKDDIIRHLKRIKDKPAILK